MTGEDPRVVRAAWDLICKLNADSDAEIIEKAIAFTLRVSWPGQGDTSLSGLYRDPMTALAAAERFERDLNVGIDPDPPFRVTVVPIDPHDGSAALEGAGS